MVSFYLDSADRATVMPLLRTGLFAGVTTNPSILRKSGLGTQDVPAIIDWAVDAGASHVFAQVSGSSVAELVDRAEAWRDLSDRVVIKLAYSPDGIAAARQLASEGDVLVTALHRSDQILPVALSGAAYAAAFIARMDAAGRDGIGEAVAMQRAVDATGSRLRLLAGSLRTPAQILALVQEGVSHMTFAPEIWESFFDDPATRAAVDAFAALAAEDEAVSA